MNLQNYCRKNDAEIQRRIDRGIWRPSLDTGHVYSTVKRGYLCEIERNGYKTVTDHYQTFVSRGLSGLRQTAFLRRILRWIISMGFEAITASKISSL